MGPQAAGRDDTDGRAARSRDAQLEALALARQSANHHNAARSRWLVAAGIVFVLVWIATDISVAIYTLMAAGVLLLFLVQKGRLSVSPSADEREAQVQASTLAISLLQDAAERVAPWLRVRSRSPITAQLVREAALLRHRIDYLSGEHCLTGLVGGRAPFCAAFIEAGYFAEAINYRTTRKRTPETVFRGIFAVLDAPGTAGWVTLEHTAIAGVSQLMDALQDDGDASTLPIGHEGLDRTFTLRASAPEHARRSLSPVVLGALASFVEANHDLRFSMTIRNEMIAVVIPMADDPFTLRDNPAVWEHELQAFADTAETVATLLETLHASRPADRQAVA